MCHAQRVDLTEQDDDVADISGGSREQERSGAHNTNDDPDTQAR